MIERIRITGWPVGIALTAPAAHPRTAEEAARFVKEQNAREKAKREREDREPSEKLEGLRRQGETWKGTGRAGRPRPTTLSPAAIYAARHAPPEARGHPTPAAPTPRPRSLAEIARAHYGGPADGAGLIASAPKGGAR